MPKINEEAFRNITSTVFQQILGNFEFQQALLYFELQTG